MGGLISVVRNDFTYLTEYVFPESARARPFFSWGLHLLPLASVVLIIITLSTCLAMWYEKDRSSQKLCMDIYNDAEHCREDTSWIVPTISFTGQRDPEWLIFSIGLTIGGILMMAVVHLVHRRAWAAATYSNRDLVQRGKLMTDPRVFCVPCCCCTDNNETPRFMMCPCGRTWRPTLKCMLKCSEVAGTVSSFFLIFVGWARMTYSYNLHNLVAYVFFGGGIIYIPLFTLCQHNIRLKCPSEFRGDWRFKWKVGFVACLIVIALTFAAVFLDLFLSCEEWKTSRARRVGFPVGEYIAATFIGFFILTHIEDIRQDDWAYAKEHKYSAQQFRAERRSTVSSTDVNDARPSAAPISLVESQPDYVSTFKPPGTGQALFETGV